MDIKQIEHLAELSKLEITEEEKQILAKEFDGLVEFADVIRNSNVEPKSKLKYLNMSQLREDKVKESSKTEILLKNAPVESKGCFVVPKIVE